MGGLLLPADPAAVSGLCRGTGAARRCAVHDGVDHGAEPCSHRVRKLAPGLNEPSEVGVQPFSDAEHSAERSWVILERWSPRADSNSRPAV